MKTKDTQEHTCGLYVRVSTDRQAAVEEGSLDAQISNLKAYVDYENRTSGGKWSIEETYREEGRSGKDLKRPEFERMVEDIHSGRINTILIWKIDRLTRSLSDFYNIWETLGTYGVQLISLNEKFDTGTAMGRAMLKFTLIWAELEREQTSERTASTLAYRASQGLWNGGKIIGYDNDPEHKGGLRINEEQAAIVRLAFNSCVELRSASATMRLLNEKGYRLPVYESRRGKTQGGKMFTKQGVMRILTNQTYIGKIRWKDGVFDGQHDPIVSEDIFANVQVILNKNRKYCGANLRKPKRHVFLLQGLMKCGKCGSAMTPSWGMNGSKQPYHYYWCNHRQKSGKLVCDTKSVPAEPLEKLILDRLKELSTDDTEVRKIVEEANSRQTVILKKLAQDRKQATRQHQSVAEKLEGLVSVVETGGAKAFKSISKRMQELEAEAADLTTQLQQIEFEEARIRKETLSAEAMAQSFRTIKEIIEKGTPEAIQAVIPTVVEIIEWHENPDDPGSGHYRMAYFEQARLVKKSPAEQCGNICSAERMNWLRRLGSNQQPSG